MNRKELRPVFYDAQQRRWRRTRRVLEISGGVLTLLLFTFLFTAVQKADLPRLLLPTAHPRHAVREKRRAKSLVRRASFRLRPAALRGATNSSEPLRAAFYVSWDRTSLASLQEHYRDLDLVIPETLHVVSPDGRLDREVDPQLQHWMRSSGVEVATMPLVNNVDGAVWRGQEFAELLRRAEASRRLVDGLVRFVTIGGDAGLVLDFEELPEPSQPEFQRFVQELATALHQIRLKLMVTVPAADRTYDYARLAALADAIILMDYDQHQSASPPGPIAAQGWFVNNLRKVLRKVPREKVIVAIAGYAYDWTETRRGNPRPEAQSMSFQQAIVTAKESEASVQFDPDSLNPHFDYADEEDRTHQVWMLDAVTAYNEIRTCRRAGARGTALWRLGSEDPSLWSIWEAPQGQDATGMSLNDVPPGYDLIEEGEGDIWRITDTPQRGQRRFTYDRNSDAIVDESFTAYPLSYHIEQMGAIRGKIALTFDDGPDPRFTPRVLDILKEKHVRATFFVIGIEANNAPALLRRIYLEGHELGNHTYTHPHFDNISEKQVIIELNLTQRLLESQLGVKTILFRPPYVVDHQSESTDEIRLLPLAQSLGYVIVGSRIDPRDWGELGGGLPPPADVILQRVLEQARAGQGNIVLLHDGGGDRSGTVAALPEIIDRLRAGGFELVTVSDLLGQTRAQVMPLLNPDEWWLARADAFVFDLYHWLRLIIAVVFVAGIGLVSARALLIGLLAVVEKLRPAPVEHPEFRPRVSVLIPAFNEEAVIVKTVRAALDSSYPECEVIVVDDGSSDGTSERLEENFGRHPQVRLLRQTNQGKAAGLNLALAKATGAVVVTIDADTAIDREAISNLVRHFANPRVGAVAGNAKVANRNRWLTRWQALEYITSQNLEKRAFDLLNCITVVPGAVGALRTEAVRACDGFPTDTLAEDTDLTLALRRRGWRIRYDDEAIGRTQAPETPAALARQRFRWTFGTLQAVWKHRDTLARRRYGTLGWVALPNVFLFQILLPLFSPLIDLLFLGSLALWGAAQIHAIRFPALWTADDLRRSFIFFVGFMLIDFLTCVIAFALEKNEEWSLLAPLLLQRFYYRQMMYWILFSALVRAVQGQAVGWGTPPPSAKPAAYETAIGRS